MYNIIVGAIILTVNDNRFHLKNWTHLHKKSASALVSPAKRWTEATRAAQSYASRKILEEVIQG
jgi:hypothetical protein